MQWLYIPHIAFLILTFNFTIRLELLLAFEFLFRTFFLKRPVVSDVSNLLRCSVFFLISLSQIVFTLSVFASRVKTVVSEEQTASELKLSWQEDAGAETTKYWLSGSGSSTWQEFKIGILKIASCIHIQTKLYARPVRVRHIIEPSRCSWGI